MKNIGAESSYPRRQGCDEILHDKTFWSINSDESSLLTSTNISGYYLRMIRSYISSFDELSKVSVKPAINKELEEDFSEPIITVQRGTLTPMNVGIMNGELLSDTGIMDVGTFSEKYPEANFYESTRNSELVSMSMTATVYGLTVAEVEKICVLVYNLLLAASYDAMKKTFDFVIGVNPPTLSPVAVTEKHSEVYSAQISWQVDYKDDAILLIRKNVIKYATIMLRESEEERKSTSSDET
jgi:hypothetical protein